MKTLTHKTVVETQTVSHAGTVIVLYCIHDELHGDFWGWIVDKYVALPAFRYRTICLDDAKCYIDEIHLAPSLHVPTPRAV